MQENGKVEKKQYLLTLINKSKNNDKDAQKELYDYLRNISAPIAYSLKKVALRSGLNSDDFDASVYDAMFNIIFKNDVKNVNNFDSYFKTSYKYSLIARIRDNVQFYKSFALGLEEERDEAKALFNFDYSSRSANYSAESNIEIVVDVLYDARKYFSSTEYAVLMMVLEGFSIPEIIIVLNSTKYKIYRIYQKAVNKLKRIVGSIFPAVVE